MSETENGFTLGSMVGQWSPTDGPDSPLGGHGWASPDGEPLRLLIVLSISNRTIHFVCVGAYPMVSPPPNAEGTAVTP